MIRLFRSSRRRLGALAFDMRAKASAFTAMRGLLAAVLLAIAAPAFAQTPLPAAEQPAFNAVGRVNIAGYKTRSMCTGTLIAPTRVLTAAHCLRGPTGDFAPPSEIHFLAGYRQGEIKAHRKGVRILAPDAQAGDGGRTRADLMRDIAILELDAAISDPDITPIALAPPPEHGQTAAIIAYRRDRPHIVSQRADCRVLTREASLLGLTCPVVPGSSGGPVLMLEEGATQLVGVVIASVSGDAVQSLAIIPDETALKPLP